MSTLPLTASQTVGPFFSPCLLREDARRNVLVQPNTAGERIRIEGRVLDGDGEPVPDALVEIWQANTHGRYNHPADQSPAPLDPTFIGFGRSGTEDDGAYWFETVKPGSVPLNRERGTGAKPRPEGVGEPVGSREQRGTGAEPRPEGVGGPYGSPNSRNQAPHIVVTVFARGLLNHAVTRLYFADESSTETDPVLQRVPADRRHTLVAKPSRTAGQTVYRFDIVLQGAGETAFFNL